MCKEKEDIFDEGDCLEKLLICEVAVKVVIYALMISSVYSPY